MSRDPEYSAIFFDFDATAVRQAQAPSTSRGTRHRLHPRFSIHLDPMPVFGYDGVKYYTKVIYDWRNCRRHHRVGI